MIPTFVNMIRTINVIEMVNKIMMVWMISTKVEIIRIGISDLIFVIFSPHRNFLDKFFSTQKCVNYDKTDFATKFVNFDKTDFFKKIA